MGVLPVCLCSRSVPGAHRGWRGASAFTWVLRTEPDFLEGQPVLFCAIAAAPLCSVLDVSLWKFGLLYLSEDASSLFLTCSERAGV